MSRGTYTNNNNITQTIIIEILARIKVFPCCYYYTVWVPLYDVAKKIKM